MSEEKDKAEMSQPIAWETMPAIMPVESRWRRRDHLEDGDFRLMRLSKKLSEARVRFVQDETARNAVTNFCKNIVKCVTGGYGFVISGDPGVGKSCAASIIAMEARRWTFTVGVFSHEEMQEFMFNDREFNDSMSMLDRARSVDLLLLDNFNEDFIADNRFGPLQMEKLIARRQNDVKSTLLTTRIPGSQWKKDPRLKSLWGQLQASNIGVVINGNDLRSTKTEGFRLVVDEGKR